MGKNQASPGDHGILKKQRIKDQHVISRPQASATKNTTPCFVMVVSTCDGGVNV